MICSENCASIVNDYVYDNTTTPIIVAVVVSSSAINTIA